MSEMYKSGEVLVRAATKDDMQAVVDMIQELADFEEMPDGPKLKIEDLIHDGFETDPPAFLCKVAEVQQDKSVIGYAIYFPAYSTFKGPSLMLEDLYVRADQRRRGVGRLLFDSVAKEAASRTACRLEFHVLEWNPAIEFYKKKGAVNLTQQDKECYYRLSGDALHSLAKQ